MGIIERRIREKQRRIDEIVDAAKRTFQAKGFSNATMNDIADFSELSRRTVYMYFKSKEELSLSVALLGLNALAENIEAALSGKGTARDRISELFVHYSQAFASDPGSFRFLLSYGLGAKALGPDHELSRECVRAQDRLHSSVASFLTQGAADGTLRAFPNPTKAAKNILLLISSAMETAVVSAELLTDALETDPREFIDTAFDMILVYISEK
jgi:AcrR family transcriptional regulator